jgi:hypothetical protein
VFKNPSDFLLPGTAETIKYRRINYRIPKRPFSRTTRCGIVEAVPR